MDENARLPAQQDARRIAGGRRFLAMVVGTSGGLGQIRRLDHVTRLCKMPSPASVP